MILTTPVPSADGGMPSSLLSVRKRRATRSVGRRTLVDAPRIVPVARCGLIRFAVDTNEWAAQHDWPTGILFPQLWVNRFSGELRPLEWGLLFGEASELLGHSDREILSCQ